MRLSAAPVPGLNTNYGFIDPWMYYGYFRNLVEFTRDVFPGNAYGAHLAWILPGAAVYKLFAPLAANCILHLGVHTLAGVSLFLTLKWVAGARRAFAAAMLFSLNPWLTFATAWDYVDGIGIAYCLLSMALLTWAALVPVRRWALVAAGMALAATVYSNPDWVMLLPLPPLYYLGLTRAWHRTPLVRSFFVLCRWFGPGCVLVTVAFAAINHWMNGRYWFYGAPLRGVFQRNSPPAPWWQGLWQDGAPSVWLLFTMAAAAVSAVVLFEEGRNAFRGRTAAALFSWMFLGALAWMIWRQIRGNPLLGLPFRASILLPFSFLAIGARLWPELETASPRYYLDWVGPVPRHRLRRIHTHRLLEWEGTAGCACRNRYHPARRFELSSVAFARRACFWDPVSLALPDLIKGMPWQEVQQRLRGADSEETIKQRRVTSLGADLRRTAPSGCPLGQAAGVIEM